MQLHHEATRVRAVVPLASLRRGFSVGRSFLRGGREYEALKELDLRLRLPTKGLPVTDDLEREDHVVVGAHLEHLPEGAAAKVAQDLEALPARPRDHVRHGDDQVAELIVSATASTG